MIFKIGNLCRKYINVISFNFVKIKYFTSKLKDCSRVI